MNLHLVGRCLNEVEMAVNVQALRAGLKLARVESPWETPARLEIRILSCLTAHEP